MLCRDRSLTRQVFLWTCVLIGIMLASTVVSAAYPCNLWYVASQSDTWDKVSEQTNTDVSRLRSLNAHLTGATFADATPILVRDLCSAMDAYDEGYYIVHPGDTLFGIARKYGLHVSDLVYHNKLSDDVLSVGSKLTIPERANSLHELQQRITPEERDLLARLVQAEAGIEPLDGKIAVAAVVINRVLSDLFPATVGGVIMQDGQFTPVINGTIHNSPSDAAFIAVERALQGDDPTGEALFFANLTKATGATQSMFNERLRVTAVIGRHTFGVLNDEGVK